MGVVVGIAGICRHGELRSVFEKRGTKCVNCVANVDKTVHISRWRVKPALNSKSDSRDSAGSGVTRPEAVKRLEDSVGYRT
jgi:hypothetical protein